MRTGRNRAPSTLISLHRLTRRWTLPWVMSNGICLSQLFLLGNIIDIFLARYVSTFKSMKNMKKSSIKSNWKHATFELAVHDAVFNIHLINRCLSQKRVERLCTWHLDRMGIFMIYRSRRGPTLGWHTTCNIIEDFNFLCSIHV